MEYDIVFLHPPSSFTKLDYPLGGVFAAQTGTTDFFVGMPVGLVNMAHQLRKSGYKTRVFNIAEYLKMYGTGFNLGQFIDTLNARAYGVDLHWAVHTPGALDLAALVKAKQPDSFVFLGGLTASYFCNEILMTHPCIDGIMLGECDDAIVSLASQLKAHDLNKSLVANLAYRERDRIVRNEVALPTLNEFNFYNYYSVVEPTPTVSRNLMLPVIRGCMQNCPFCGGSGFSYRNFYRRPKPVALAPDKVFENIKAFARRGGEYVNLLGDIRCGGRQYVDELLGRIKEISHKIYIKNELFYPGDREYLQKWAQHCDNLNLVLSPESTDDRVMKAVGKGYTCREVEQQVKWCNEWNIDLSLSFLFALPYQTLESIQGTLGFIERMTDLADSRISFMFEPMLFIDPGSMIFEEPERWGYDIDFLSVKDIDANLRKSHWSYSLGYSTKWMNKEEILEAVFLVNQKLVEMYFNLGELSTDDYGRTLQNIELNRLVIKHKADNGSSEVIAGFINNTFPPYLLDDNNLIKYSMNQQTVF